MCLWAGWGEGAAAGTLEAPLHPQAPHIPTVHTHRVTHITPVVPSCTLLSPPPPLPRFTSPRIQLVPSRKVRQDLMGSQRGSEKSVWRQAKSSAQGQPAGPRPRRKRTPALGARRDPRGCSRGSPSRGSRCEGGGLGSQRCGRGCGLDGHRSRMATPHLVLSGAVSHRLSGDLDSPHRPRQRPQTYRGPSTAERPAAPGRDPSWLQATCSRRASGRGGGCGRGSSGTPAWQGEASIRKETKPLAQLEGPSPFLAS